MCLSEENNLLLNFKTGSNIFVIDSGVVFDMNNLEPVQRNDLVSLIEAHTDLDIPKDEIGRVLSILNSGEYEVEFVDERYKTQAIIALKPEQVIVFKHEATLTDDEFWQLIDDAIQAEPDDGEKRVQWLVDKVATYSIPDIDRYGEIFRRYHNQTYRNDLWAAGYVINNGCSDDGFKDFRAWLIAQGKAVYEDALLDPETLVDVASLIIDEYEYYGDASLESMNYVESYAYRKKTGKEFPSFHGIYQPAQLQGEDWDEETVDQLYPKLAAKFWYTGDE